MISIKKHPKGCFFAARITNNGSKGKNPSYSSFRAHAVSRGIFPSGRFYLVLVLFCHVRGFLHSAGAKGLNDMTGGVFCIIGNSSGLSRAERHIGRSLRFRWEGHVFNRGILRVDVDHMGRLYGFAYWFCNISYYFLIKILILIRKASPEGAACFVIYKERNHKTSLI